MGSAGRCDRRASVYSINNRRRAQHGALCHKRACYTRRATSSLFSGVSSAEQYRTRRASKPLSLR